MVAVRRLSIWIFKKFRLEVKTSGIQPRTGRIAEIRTYDRTVFNSDRRFYRYLNDVGEYIEDTAEQEQVAEVNTVMELLDEIENEALHQALLTVDKHTLQIVLLKMQGYSTKEIAVITGLTKKAIYKRLDRLREKLKSFNH